jgi:hypothetical protein
MQDFNYWKYGCIELTLEISCCKYPHKNQLSKIWQENRHSLIEYLKKSNTGVKGIINFSNGQLAQNLTVKIDSRRPYFKTNKNGEFYRILLPGTYQLELLINCTSIYKTTFKITFLNELVELNITLSSNAYIFYENLINSTLSPILNKYAIFCDDYKTGEGSSHNRIKLNCFINYFSFENLIYMNNNFKLLLIFVFFIYFLYVYKAFLKLTRLNRN